MRALQFTGGSTARLVDLDHVPLRPGWARVAVAYSSVCGSDLWLYQGRWHGHTYPVVPGHEWAGVVSAVNEAPNEWVGRRVIGDLIHACGWCDACRDGLPVMCASITEIGFTIDGGCAEFVDVPFRNLYQLPDDLPLRAACQAEPLAVALHAVDRAALRPAERVAVLGCGGIGLLILQAARCAGAMVELATDPVPYRRDVARDLGAARTGDASSDCYTEAGHHRYDVVFEASGAPESVSHGLDLLRPGGRLVAVGYRVGATYPIETAKLPLAYASLVGVMGPGGKYRHALSLLHSGAITTGPLLTDVVKLDDHEVALSAALDRRPGTIRVVFEMGVNDG